VSRRWPLALVSALALVVVGYGFITLRASVHTYEQRYTDCMEVQKSWAPNRLIPFPSREYEQAKTLCERQANQ